MVRGLFSSVRIHFSIYELTPVASLGSRAQARPRQGALIRVEDLHGMGYADLHPWPELGDLALGEQLELLSQGKLTALTRSSLSFAKVDALARARGLGVFEGSDGDTGTLEIPPSHFLVTDPDGPGGMNESAFEKISAAGFTRMKIKVGRDARSETELLSRACRSLGEEVRFRLDFNAARDLDFVENWLTLAGKKDCLGRIDFLEDPVLWNPEAWLGLKRKFGVRLAGDREIQSIPRGAFGNCVDVRVLKPAIQGAQGAYKDDGLGLVFTSYLDHPFGQLCAAFAAARFAKVSGRRLEVCGFLSQGAYERNAFSDYLRHEGPLLKPAPGTGFGFDELLAALPWKDLK